PGAQTWRNWRSTRQRRVCDGTEVKVTGAREEKCSWTAKGRRSHATTGCNTWMDRSGRAVRRTAAVWLGRGPDAPDTAPVRQDVLPRGRAGLRQSAGE